MSGYQGERPAHPPSVPTAGLTGAYAACCSLTICSELLKCPGYRGNTNTPWSGFTFICALEWGWGGVRSSSRPCCPSFSAPSASGLALSPQFGARTVGRRAGQSESWVVMYFCSPGA